MEKDALRDKKIESGGGGLFFKVAPGSSAKIRVLTTDPYVTKDKWGNTRYSFVIYNFTEEKAQVLNKGPGIASKIQTLHQDDDYGADIQKLDLKITSTSTGPEAKDVRYDINPLPKAEELTQEQITEATKIKLEDAVTDNGLRLSVLKDTDSLPDNTDEPEEHDSGKDEVVLDDDEPVNLDDIPF